ncbi:MAG: 30S ribosomal protein S6 [Lachnospiraceae bacterium]|nr:30S ribosomal protein S6 [Lachnospiraceae bacterium]
MNKYELAVVISGKLEEDDKNVVLGKVKDLVERFGGKITSVDEQGKKRFAYEVAKMKEGYYNFIHFEAEANVPAEIESRIRIMDNVVRYLIVVDDVEAPAPKAEKPAESAETEAAE